MKKIVCVLSVILLGSALYAGPVTPEKALQVARSVFASAPATKAAVNSELSIVWDGEFEQTKGALNPAFYVVTRPEGGFVMVAGDDNVQPVLGFSFENDFKVEGMPENVRAWMEQYKSYVRSVESATPAINDQWARYQATKTSASPITSGLTDEFLASRTNEWNQTNPANFFCPKVEGQEYTSVCGCVALAIAEIMVWFGDENLAEVSGTIPGYSYTSANSKSVSIPGRTLDHFVYRWADLKTLTTSTSFYNQISDWTGAPANNDNKYYGGSTEGTSLTALGENLAHLLFDIGSLVQANYNYDPGTGAVSANAIITVAPFMGYNNTARLVNKDEYTNGQWQQMLKDEIKQHPVLYDGTSDSGAHAYVADGYGTYSGNLMFHFNLGWAGSNNGYYTLDIQHKYYKEHAAILGFYPNPGHSTPLPAMGYYSFVDSEVLYYGGIVNTTGYNTGTLSFDLQGIFNVGSAAFSGDIFAARKNTTGTVVERTNILADIVGLPVGSGWGIYGTFDVGSSTPTLALGDMLEMQYKESSKDTYLSFVATPANPIPTTIPYFPAAAIKKNASYSVNDYFVFELTNNNYMYSSSTWTVTTPGGTTSTYTTDDYRVQLTEAGDYKITCTTTGEETVVAFITVL